MPSYLYQTLSFGLSITLVLLISSFLPIRYVVNFNDISFIDLYPSHWSDGPMDGQIRVGFPWSKSFNWTIPLTCETQLSNFFYLIISLEWLHFSHWFTSQSHLLISSNIWMVKFGLDSFGQTRSIKLFHLWFFYFIKRLIPIHTSSLCYFRIIYTSSAMSYALSFGMSSSMSLDSLSNTFSIISSCQASSHYLNV